MYCLIYIPPLIPFATINSISISVNTSSCTFAFSKTSCHVNRGAVKKTSKFEFIY